jgi:hypothetical protein
MRLNKTALAFGIGASLILAAGTANAAGTCATEVQALQQQLGMQEGPNATIGPSDPGVQQPAPEANATTGTSTTMNSDSTNADGSSVTTQDTTGANATIGPSDPGVQQPQNEDMDATADSSSSSNSSTSTMPAPTVTETSRAGEMDTAAGDRAAAMTSLKKAKLYANAGQEDACMSELGMAKQHLGVE